MGIHSTFSVVVLFFFLFFFLSFFLSFLVKGFQCRSLQIKFNAVRNSFPRLLLCDVDFVRNNGGSIIASRWKSFRRKICQTSIDESETPRIYSVRDKMVWCREQLRGLRRLGP